MKIIVSLLIGLLSVVLINGQTNKAINPSEYIVAENYGGKVELKRFLQQEMDYPAKALANKTEGTVELAFVIDTKTGKRSELHVKKTVSEELDREAIRLYRLLQFKKPYYRAGKATLYSTLKIKFSTKNYKRFCKARGYEKANLDTNVHDTSMVIYKNNRLRIKPKIVFGDSLSNLSRFIYNNLKYPSGTLQLNLKGTVKLQFIVEPTGRITNIKSLNGLGGGATAETERLLKLLKWKAGELAGKKVRTIKEFEVNYTLSNNSGMDYVPTNY